MGVCSILWGKPLQNLSYQWPFCERLRKEKDDFHVLDNWVLCTNCDIPDTLNTVAVYLYTSAVQVDAKNSSFTYGVPVYSFTGLVVYCSTTNAAKSSALKDCTWFKETGKPIPGDKLT